MLLPCPLGSIHPAVRGCGSASSTLPTKSSCQRRNRSGDNAPVPFGVLIYVWQNRANRAEPTDRGRHGNGDGSTDALGPAFMASSEHG